MSVKLGIVDRFKRPEYTGENRCVPCTVVNLVIAAVLAVGVAVLGPTQLGPLLGLLVVLVAVVTVYFRGYLVPGTPWFTETYFPTWLLARFEKHHAPVSVPYTDEGEFDVESALVDAEVLEECQDVDDLCLTDEFGRAWRDRIHGMREADTSRADLAALLGTDADRLTFDEYGDAFVASDASGRIGQWESRAAFLADVAAGTELSTRADTWDHLDVEERGALLTGLRLFIERCPSCDAPVAVEEEVKRSCCRSFDVVAATCTDCEARLFEAKLPQAG